MPRDQAYLLAEKRIEEALETGARELRITGIELTELPESIGRLENLQSLNISFNKLQELPQSLAGLTKLNSLQLYINELTIIPDSLQQLTNLKHLDLAHNRITILPDWLGNFEQLELLELYENTLTYLPESIGALTKLKTLKLQNNRLSRLPETLGNLTQLSYLDLSKNILMVLFESIGNLIGLQTLNLSNNELSYLTDSIGQLINLESLDLSSNKFTDIPSSIVQTAMLKNYESNPDEEDDFILDEFRFEEYQSVPYSPEYISDDDNLGNNYSRYPSSSFRLDDNPLNPELAEAYKQGLSSVKAYLHAKAQAQIILNEAKLILVGEGEVGKTCLMDALLDKPWQEHLSTHGIDIQQVKIIDAETNKEITLNGWDFGGQRVYRPTHQLFFSAPAVYLVVWKPREGPQQGFVKEWIQLVKRREPSAKIIVVATHGGPQQRQPDIDRQELWDLFGKETVVDFFFVDSKPDAQGHRKGIEELKVAVAHVASELPEVGRSVPKSFADVRVALSAASAPYLPLDEVLAICRAHGMDDEIARLFITISHRLGHLTHYENDPALRDIVILRPDWLATAMSYVLDDEETRKNQGLVKFSRLSQLWDDPDRPEDTRYPDDLHKIFLRLMERFDLSYRVAGLSKDEEVNPVSLIAQLVSDTTPEAEKFNKAWTPEPAIGDIQQTQICRIVDANSSHSANAEGLFYQLIVRLHRYSLGRAHWDNSIHWQRGLVLDADYNGRALLRHIGNDVHITVRAAYPQGFLNTLTDEVKYLVESFWEGLRCEVTVPCMATENCKGLFEVSKLIENKRRGREEVPCTTCNEWQSVDSLLLNVPAAQPIPSGKSLSSEQVITQLTDLRSILIQQTDTMIGRFDNLDAGQKELLSKAETSYQNLIKVFTDEAKEGPRLFSFVPVDRSNFNPQKWISAKFRLILWCEHSRWPLPILNGKDSTKGIYEFELTREWFKKIAPVLKTVTNTLSIVLPIASSAVKLVMDESQYKNIENELAFGKEVINGVLSAGKSAGPWVDSGDAVDLEHGTSIRAENAALRELHTLLKSKDPGFGGLVRVLNKRNEFLWVHEKFAGEY